MKQKLTLLEKTLRNRLMAMQITFTLIVNDPENPRNAELAATQFQLNNKVLAEIKQGGKE